MARYKVIVKTNATSCGVRIEKGMSVDLVSFYSNVLTMNGGKLVNDAFLRIYGIDLKKLGLLNIGYLEVKKME